MKLGTLRDGTRDGRLVVVSRDGSRWAGAEDIAPTLQRALDEWDLVGPRLRGRFEALQAGQIPGKPVDVTAFGPPLPRAYEWIDGSAYLNHVRLVRKARGAEPPPTLETDPLIYQGGSGHLLGPTEDIPLIDPAWGLDFEAEVVAILGDVRRGTKADHAAECVRLLTICNDVSLRGLIPGELAKGFGFFVSKPATAFAPFAITPEELGPDYRDGRIHRTLRSVYNEELVGDVHAGPEMHFSFHQLIEHIAQSRAFTAGTLLGSGTISNEDRSAGISCLAERRMIETIENGQPETPFMKVGDTIRIEMLDDAGTSIFGTIDQKVVEG
ncbi:MAG TPA: fumarylacetoacetate hydrolase family protein [Myxococcales bacterium LLY-WYZ-16_1]|jgi:fumarylacetoacetate (FAA) hydrolase|nr:fumarylacetoacetate hydrolase family protein [Myxococcales bacterium LLY-WYZ-16_1]